MSGTCSVVVLIIELSACLPVTFPNFLGDLAGDAGDKDLASSFD